MTGEKVVEWNKAKPGDLVAAGTRLLRGGLSLSEACWLADASGGQVWEDGDRWAVVETKGEGR